MSCLACQHGPEVDLLKVDVDSMPHDELIQRLLVAGLRPKAGQQAEAGCMLPASFHQLAGGAHRDWPNVSSSSFLLAQVCLWPSASFHCLLAYDIQRGWHGSLEDEDDPLVYTPRPELVGLIPSLARVDSVQS